ncbi:MAG: hypothetical protein ACLQVX_00010 [Limisphaerales bacterium]
MPTELRTEVETAFTFLADYADSQRLNVSKEDLKALAVGFAAQIPVVTDDASSAVSAGGTSPFWLRNLPLGRFVASSFACSRRG